MSSFPHFMTILPAVFLLAMTCVVLMVSVFVKQPLSNYRWTYYLSQFSLVGTFVLMLKQSSIFSSTLLVAHQSLIIDHLSVISILFILFLSFFIFLYAKKDLMRLQLGSGEFYTLGLFSILGMIIMVSAYNLMTMYLAIELMSLPFYALCAYKRKSTKGTEAAIKYFVTGAIASGLLLYGISLVYGVTHSFDFAAMAQAMQSAPHDRLIILLVGIVFVLSGFAFKFGVVPFHMWVPDVYEGAPTIVILFLSSVPKIAVFSLMVRLFYVGFSSVHTEWHHLLTLLAVISIFLGNIVALAQQNIKRMFAYSSIAHMGYMLLALGTGTAFGLSAAMFYTVTYALVSVGAFGVLILLSNKNFNVESFSDLAGLNSRHPWLAFILLLFVFSMAGMPPTVGFIAKLGIVMTLVKTHQIGLAVFLVLMAVAGLYYYLRVVKTMYFEKPEKNNITSTSLSADTTVAISINGILVLTFGIFPVGLLTLCHYGFV